MQNKESPKKKSVAKKIQGSLKKEIVESALCKNMSRLKKYTIVSFDKLKHAQNVSQNNYNLGIKFFELNEFDEAIMRFKFAAWVNPKHAETWYWLGASYAEIENKKKASKALKKAIELKPDLQDARDMLKALDSVG